MTLQEIVEKYLKENGYDGLFDQWECACVLGDLMPCDEPKTDCEAVYKRETGPSSDFDFVVSRYKDRD